MGPWASVFPPSAVYPVKGLRGFPARRRGRGHTARPGRRPPVGGDCRCRRPLLFPSDPTRPWPGSRPRSIRGLAWTAPGRPDLVLPPGPEPRGRFGASASGRTSRRPPATADDGLVDRTCWATCPAGWPGWTALRNGRSRPPGSPDPGSTVSFRRCLCALVLVSQAVPGRAQSAAGSARPHGSISGQSGGHFRRRPPCRGWLGQVPRRQRRVLRAVGPCARCVVTIDQNLQGPLPALEPLRTLATYRRSGAGSMFGVNLVVDRAGQVHRGRYRHGPRTVTASIPAQHATPCDFFSGGPDGHYH